MHPPENLLGECPNARSVLNDDAGSVPIDLFEDTVDDERGTGKHPAHQIGILEKITSKENDLLKPGTAHLVPSSDIGAVRTWLRPGRGRRSVALHWLGWAIGGH